MNFLKTSLFTLLLCLVAGFTVYGQSVEWIKSIPIAKEQDCSALYPTENKGFWLGGYTYKDPHRYGSTVYPKLMLMAVDSLGDTLWQKNYFNTYKIGFFTNILPAPAGKYLIGNFSHDTTANQQRLKPLLIYVDNNGETIAHYDNIVAQCTDLEVYDAKVVGNGDVVFVGFYSDFNPATCTRNNIPFAIRIDPSSGLVLWDKMYTPIPGTASYVSRIAELPNGNLLLSGPLNNGIMGLVLDANTGNLLQVRNIPTGFSSNFFTANLAQLSDGGFIATGYNVTGQGYLARLDANLNKLWEKVGGKRSTRAYEMPNGHFLLESYDSQRVLHISKLSIATGDTIWKMKLGSPLIDSVDGTPLSGERFELTGGAVFDGKGNAVIAGTQWNPVMDWQLYPYMLGYNMFSAKLKDVGVPLTNFCQQGPQASFAGALVSDTLKLNSTSISNVTFHDTLQYQWFVGGVALSASNQTLQQPINVSQYPQGVPVKLVITNHWGCKDSLTAVVTADGVVGNKPDIRGGAYLKNAYPNPSAQNVSIGYTLPAKTENAILRVYELGTGITVAERNLSALDSEIKFNVSGWATGVYAYQLYVNDAPVAVKKLTVSR